MIYQFLVCCSCCNNCLNILFLQIWQQKCSKFINLFCFLCGQFTPKKNAARISPQILNGYNSYFGIDAKKEMSKSWAPNVICATCVLYLRSWLIRTKKSIPYAVPMIWRKQTNHETDCYFCQTNLTGYSIKTRQKSQFCIRKTCSRQFAHLMLEKKL